MLKLVKDISEEISCTLLPGKYTSAAAVPSLYNSTYAYWKKTWSEYFEKAGSGPGALNIENFMRHTFLITLHKENQIAGTLLSTCFNLSAATTFDHPCVQLFPQNIIEKLKAEGEGLCITGEYLSVHPDFRKSKIGVSLADVMIGILMKIFQEQKMKMLLATTIRDAKVDVIAKEYGCSEIGSYVKIGVPCIMLSTTQDTLKSHSSPEVNGLVAQLWETRIDATGITKSPPTMPMHKTA